MPELLGVTMLLLAIAAALASWLHSREEPLEVEQEEPLEADWLWPGR